MWIFALIAFGLMNGALCTKESCLYDVHMECGVYQIIPNRFPGNEEELQNACSNVTRIKQCISDSLSNCSSIDDVTTEMYRGNDDEVTKEKNRIRRWLKEQQRLIDITTEICRPDSELHANFVPDMVCYQEIFDTNDREQHCRDYSENAMDYIRSRVKALYARDETGELYKCLDVLLSMNCFLEQFIQKCSYRAKDTVLEIIEKGGTLYDQCPNSIRIDILELFDSLKLVTGKEIHVRKLLLTDSFF